MRRPRQSPIRPSRRDHNWQRQRVRGSRLPRHRGAADQAAPRSSGNVFADAGLPDADSQLVKAQLVSRIDGIIRARGLSQREAAPILDVAQPDLSNLLPGRFRGYSVERLRRMEVAQLIALIGGLESSAR